MLQEFFFEKRLSVGIRVLCKNAEIQLYRWQCISVLDHAVYRTDHHHYVRRRRESWDEMVHALRIFALCVVALSLNKFTVAIMNLLKRLQIAAKFCYLPFENAVAVLPATFINFYLKQIDGIGTNGIGAAFVADHNPIAAWIFRKIKHKNLLLYCSDQNPRNQS